MNDLMQERALITKKINVMVRKIEGVNSFVLAGNDRFTPDELYFVVTADHAVQQKVFDDLNFLIREFLKPIDIRKAGEDGRLLINYTFDSGLKTQVILCGDDDLPAFEWWVLFLDRTGAVRSAYSPSTKEDCDPTCVRPEEDETDGRAEDSPDSGANEPDESAARSQTPSQETVTEAPNPAQEAAARAYSDPRRHSESRNRELWKYFYDRVNIAKHAISGGSLIYAGEIIGELRTFLIRLMCESEGITEDYLHSIDLLPEGHRAAIGKTYPAGFGASQMISALAAEHSVFEKLMRKKGRQ